MQPRVAKLLLDIEKALGEIEIITAVFENNFHNFQTNLIARRAIEREFEIIGEAINKLQKEDATIQITDARKIIALRNVITHAYDKVDNEILWAILINFIPVLDKEIRLLLNK